MLELNGKFGVNLFNNCKVRGNIQKVGKYIPLELLEQSIRQHFANWILLLVRHEKQSFYGRLSLEMKNGFAIIICNIKNHGWIQGQRAESTVKPNIMWKKIIALLGRIWKMYEFVEVLFECCNWSKKVFYMTEKIQGHRATWQYLLIYISLLTQKAILELGWEILHLLTRLSSSQSILNLVSNLTKSSMFKIYCFNKMEFENF